MSVWQDRAIRLTSAPEEDFLSVHVKCSDSWTNALATSVGCKSHHWQNRSATGSSSSVIGVDEKDTNLNVDLTIRNPLPPVSVEGPYGSSPSKLWGKDVAILVAVGSSVTVYASILKSIWYRMNFAYEKTALHKVYFFWLCDDIRGFEWFESLLSAIEGQNFDDNIELHPVSHRSQPKPLTN